MSLPTVTAPEEWDVFIRELEEKGLTAIIAGGAVRDLYCNVKPRDIDIFIWNEGGTTNPWISKVRAHVTSTQGKWKDLTGYEPDEANMEGNPIYTVYEINRNKWYRFFNRKPLLNLICCIASPNGALGIISAFDFGICQAAYDGKHFYVTENFVTDFQNHTFTMIHGKKFLKSMERFKRIGKRYPGWTLQLSGKAWHTRVLDRFKQAAGNTGETYDY